MSSICWSLSSYHTACYKDPFSCIIFINSIMICMLLYMSQVNKSSKSAHHLWLFYACQLLLLKCIRDTIAITNHHRHIGLCEHVINLLITVKLSYSLLQRSALMHHLYQQHHDIIIHIYMCWVYLD